MVKHCAKLIGRSIFKNKWLYLMLLPGLIYILIFHFVPLYGLSIAFKDFSIFKGIGSSPWVGLENFTKLFKDESFLRALNNNIIISVEKLVCGFPTPIILSLMINELRGKLSKRFVQTSVILPNFFSWIVINGLLYALFSTTSGALPGVLRSIGYEGQIPSLLTTKESFRAVIILSYLWQCGGYGTIVYLAAIAGINIDLYEAAQIDGAGRWKQLWHITLASLRPTIVVLLIFRVGEMMYAGFDQIYAIQNYSVISVSEIIDTYVYKMGLQNRHFSEATAAGLFQSMLGLILVLITNFIAKRLDPDSGLV